MKTIIYLLVAIFTFGIIARGFVNTPQNKNQITIQARQKLNKHQLMESSKIISKRLELYTSGKFDIKVIPENQQILVNIDNSWNQQEVEKLISRKGQFGIYEMADSMGLKAIIENNKKLLTLLHNTEITTSKIGCISKQEFKQVDNYLNKVEIDIRYKLVWDNAYNNSNNCLYALKANTEGASFFHASNISTFELKQSENVKREFIEFHFKDSSVDDWANFTKTNLTKPVAITLDNEILYMPVVQSEIKGGHCQIT